jgi:hypothetical protein
MWTGYGYGLRPWVPKDRTGPDFQALMVTPQEMFDLAERFLNRVQIGGIWRQVFDMDTEAISKFKNFDSMVNLHVVEDEDTKWSRVSTTFS